MPYQIALAWNDDCEKELIEKGFEKKEVYIKSYGNSEGRKEGEAISDVCERNGDHDFFSMKHKPYQFVTTSWWGAGSE